ncbi:WXG100 family type VII secretion target [Enemella evansiae]|uniref:WXG100 family type VII secretion target n=1 Tax=Enemella evansiae TaxID=2016499 RepID=UPI00117DE7D3|nr:WXG100 family type VII secretion target [Enemella evansiae]
MSDDSVLVNKQYMQQGIQDLDSAKKQMVDLKEQMVQTLGKRLDSWQDGGDGAAPKQAYQQVLRTWDESMKEMENIANAMRTNLDTIAGNYASNEMKTASFWETGN